MMKFIHCADIHLGSPMESLPREKRGERRAEVLSTFDRMVEYAVREQVTAILISGDLFDSDRPIKRDKEYFYSAVKNNPQIDFVYLRGNHDSLQSYVETDLPNLKTFSDVWTKYTYGEVDLYGIEFTDPNAQTLYSTLKTDPSRVNFVMLHGQTSDSVGKDKINLSKLRDRNIDYLALGHIHSFSEGELDRRGKYCYSGCLEGRGFDETGKKGFVLLTVDGGVKSEFIPFSRRTVAEYTVDMTGTQDVYEGVSRAKNAVQCAKSDLVRIVLKGEIDYSSEALQTSLQSTLESGYYVVSVKDNTTEKIDPARYLNDTSLAGEFVRGVMADPKYEEEYKKRIIALGLKVLSGREVDE